MEQNQGVALVYDDGDGFPPLYGIFISASAALDLFLVETIACHTSGCQPQCCSLSCFPIPFQQSFLSLLVHQSITKTQIALLRAFKFLQ